MKKKLCFMVTVCLLLGCLPVAAFAAGSGTCGANVIWKYDRTAGSLTISGFGEMYQSVEEWGWEEHKDSITTVTISEGVTSVGSYAFAYMTNLRDVSLPGTLQYIYGGAFEGCSSITAITLPEGLQELYAYAFYGCSGLTGIELPASMRYLELMAFGQCTSMTEFRVSGENPWLSADSSGVLHSKDKTVLYMAPGGLSGSYSIADGVQRVLPYAFFGCAALTELLIPSTVKEIGSYALLECAALESIRVSAGNSFFSNDDGGLLYNKDQTVLYRVPGGKSGTVTVAGTVREIADYALYGCREITSAELPAGQETVGNFAFANCTALTDLYFTGRCVRFAENAMDHTAATIHYPGNPIQLWDQMEKADYGGSLTWKPFYYDCDVHAWQDAVSGSAAVCGICGATMETHANRSEGLLTVTKDYTGALRQVTVEIYDSFAGQEVAVKIPETWPDLSFPASAQVIAVSVPEGTSLTLTVPMERVMDSTAVYIRNEDGSYTPLPGTAVAENGLKITLTKSCELVIAPYDPATSGNPFTDVKSDRFETAILWAYYTGITTGTGDGSTFSPENTCTRKQIVTFLWRAAGEPEPASYENPFTDVEADRFEKAILWAYHAGITTGTGDGSTFSPENACTRKQIVTFLWRAAGEPEPASYEDPFTDVEADRFEKAILWAYHAGITTGTGDGSTFSPGEVCTRKQIVTFLYRYLVE